MICIVCNAELTGNQTKFCSKKCKGKLWSKLKKTYPSQKIRRLKRKFQLSKLLGGKCCQCGYSKNLSSLCFHHRNENVKNFTITGNLSNKKLENIKLEIDKCDLLCHNCHMEKHYQNRNKTYYYNLKLELISLKNNKCQICGYSGSVAGLVFHHIDPKTKKYNLDVNSISKLTYDEVISESNKCLLLCHNCHSEIHNPQLDLNSIEEFLSNLELNIIKTNKSCKKCGNVKDPSAEYCLNCYKQFRKEIRHKSTEKYPTKEELIDMLKIYSKLKISKILHISTKTIRNILQSD